MFRLFTIPNSDCSVNTLLRVLLTALLVIQSINATPEKTWREKLNEKLFADMGPKRMMQCVFRPDQANPKCTEREKKIAKRWVATASLAALIAIGTAIGITYKQIKERRAKKEASETKNAQEKRERAILAAEKNFEELNKYFKEINPQDHGSIKLLFKNTKSLSEIKSLLDEFHKKIVAIIYASDPTTKYYYLFSDDHPIIKPLKEWDSLIAELQKKLAPALEYHRKIKVANVKSEKFEDTQELIDLRKIFGDIKDLRQDPKDLKPVDLTLLKSLNANIYQKPLEYLTKLRRQSRPYTNFQSIFGEARTLEQIANNLKTARLDVASLKFDDSLIPQQVYREIMDAIEYFEKKLERANYYKEQINEAARNNSIFDETNELKELQKIFKAVDLYQFHQQSQPISSGQSQYIQIRIPNEGTKKAVKKLLGISNSPDSLPWYKIFGFTNAPSKTDARKAYRTKSLKFHPDKTAGLVEEEKAAYEEVFKLLATAKTAGGF